MMTPRFNWSAIAGIAGTILTLAGGIVSGIVSDKKMDKKIEEEVAKAIADSKK